MTTKPGRKYWLPRADKWLEASVSVGARRFFLMDGDWFEIGADYVRASRDAIGRLFPGTPTVSLPPWSLTERRTEYDYNCYVAAPSRGQYLCLDKNRAVRDPHGARSPLEICDLLGPGDELIHVKRAEGSAPLSHLFSLRASSRRRAWLPGRRPCESVSSRRPLSCPTAGA